METDNMKLEVIIFADNKNEYTRRALESYTQQQDVDFRIAMADCSQSSVLIDLVREFSSQGLNIRLVSADNGDASRARTLNRAISGSTADYLVITDNDCLVQRTYISDHKRLAQRGRYVVGRFVELGESLSKQIINGKTTVNTINSRWWLLMNGAKNELKHAEYGLMAPWFIIKQRFRYGSKAFRANSAVWRDDFLAINGYDNGFSGYSQEDFDLDWRLRTHGLQGLLVTARASAIRLHSKRTTSDSNGYALIEANVEAGKVITNNGLTQLK
jgi:GT2 family glycosyltransferase